MKPSSFDSQLYDPQFLAETHQLGSLRRNFTPDTWIYMGIYGAFFIGTLFALGYSISHIFPDIVALVIMVICFSPLPLSLLVALIITYQRRNRRIYVYEHGLIAVRKHDIEATRWEEIALVWHRVKGGNTFGRRHETHMYTLQRRDGSTFKLDCLSTNQVLGNMIEQATADLLFPEALATYRQGTPLSFGPLTLDQSGLTYKSKSLPWYEVAKIQLTSRYLLVSKHNSFFAWASITYRDIPNLRVVQRLSDTILGQSTEAV